jgi:hypothetical protein
MNQYERDENDAIDIMKRARVNPGYYAHVESVLRHYPQSKWVEILRSIRLHGDQTWFA